MHGTNKTKHTTVLPAVAHGRAIAQFAAPEGGESRHGLLDDAQHLGVGQSLTAGTQSDRHELDKAHRTVVFATEPYQINESRHGLLDDAQHLGVGQSLTAGTQSDRHELDKAHRTVVFATEPYQINDLVVVEPAHRHHI